MLAFLCIYSLAGSYAEEAQSSAETENVIWISVPKQNDTSESPSSEGELDIEFPEKIIGFAENEISVTVQEEGILELEITGADGICRYHTSAALIQGRNQLTWNGTGAFNQPLASGNYLMKARFTGGDGAVAENSKQCVLSKNRQQLLYAIPSSNVLYLNDSSDWVVECSLSQNGSIVMDVFSFDESNTQVTRITQYVKKMTAVRLTWNGRTSTSRFVPVGRYLVQVYPESSPDQAMKMILYVQDSDKEVYSVGVTGMMVPERGMSDSEIWEIMMQPSVVYDGTEAAYLRESASMRSSRIGKINPQKQALEVLAIENEWAKVRAWGQDDGKLIEGYLQTAHLKIVLPNRQYGLMIDLADQMMSVYEEGRKIAQVPVCTGRALSSQPNWGTTPGSFLTGYHLSPGVTSGKTYECRIAYDGNRVIEQIGYENRRGVQVYSDNANLGTVSTRGTVGLPVSAEETLNAWWLYTHIPVGTRVIILDSEPHMTTAVYAEIDDVIPSYEQTITLTICGEAELGMTEYEKDNFLAEGTLFTGLQELFLTDDLTVMSLSTVLTDDAAFVRSERPGALRAGTDCTDMLTASGVEVVTLASRHFSDYRYWGRISTVSALKEAKLGIAGSGIAFVYEKNGHKIGILADREISYEENPELASDDIRRLREEGCEAVLVLCSWGTEGSGWHTLRQEIMAKHLILAGADMVIGQSGGVQGIDVFDEVPVIWNLGKIFDRDEIAVTKCSMAARITLTFSENGYEGAFFRLIPCITGRQTTQEKQRVMPEVAVGEDAELILKIAQRHSDIGIRDVMWFSKKESAAE